MKVRAAELGKNEQVLFPLYIYDRDQWRGVQKLEFIEMSLSLKRVKKKKPIRA